MKTLNATTQIRNFDEVCRILEKYDHQGNKLITILQEVQKVYKYLPEEVLTYVATSLDLSPAKVYGVASFYANFSLTPKGKHVIHICDGTACHVKGAPAIHEALQVKLQLNKGKATTDDMLFTVETVSCLGACGLAPVITVNEKVHGQMTPEAAVALIEAIQDEEQG